LLLVRDADCRQRGGRWMGVVGSGCRHLVVHSVHGLRMVLCRLRLYRLVLSGQVFEFLSSHRDTSGVGCRRWLFLDGRIFRLDRFLQIGRAPCRERV